MFETHRFVVIEDEAPIRRFLKAGLEADDRRWFEAASGQEGIGLVAREQPDLVLLDLGLPDCDGQDVLRAIREWSDVPVIVLTARGRERDKLLAFDAGADDYVTKPFSMAELVARVRATLRRAKPDSATEPTRFERDGLLVDFELRQVFLDGREVRLTPIEYRLLCYLACHAGKVATHSQLLREIWGGDQESTTHALRVHMASIRQKIEADPSHPRFIRTETGVGYRLLA